MVTIADQVLNVSLDSGSFIKPKAHPTIGAEVKRID